MPSIDRINENTPNADIVGNQTEPLEVFVDGLQQSVDNICRLVDELRAEKAELLAALKMLKRRIHFIGMPQEARRDDGAPDWRAEIAALEAAIAKAEGR